MKFQFLTPVLLGLIASPAHSALYSAGHGDIGIAYEDEGDGPEFFFHYHLGDSAIVDGVPVGNAPDGMEFEPGDITTLVAPQTMIMMPNNPSLSAATGVATGNPIWALPATSQAGVPFLGIATEELDGANWVGEITFTLGSVTAPTGAGEFTVWNIDGFNSLNVAFSTADPSTSTANNVLSLPTGEHAHFNYGFSEPGMWGVELTVAGTHVTDGPLSSTRTFNFSVVPEPSSALLAFLGATMLLRRRRA